MYLFCHPYTSASHLLHRFMVSFMSELILEQKERPSGEFDACENCLWIPGSWHWSRSYLGAPNWKTYTAHQYSQASDIFRIHQAFANDSTPGGTVQESRRKFKLGREARQLIRTNDEKKSKSNENFHSEEKKKASEIDRMCKAAFVLKHVYHHTHCIWHV